MNARRLMLAFLGALTLGGHVATAAPDHPAAPATDAPAAATDGTVAAPVPAETIEVSEPVRKAILLAKAAGGGVGFVGSVLALDENAAPDEVAIIQRVPLSKLKAGEIVMLVRDDCHAHDGCLMARKITDKHGSDLATRRYGRPQVEAADGVDASLVGRIAYAVDLKTGRIRDLRHDDTKEVTLVEALRRESRKWHEVGARVRPNRYKV